MPTEVFREVLPPGLNACMCIGLHRSGTLAPVEDSLLAGVDLEAKVGKEGKQEQARGQENPSASAPRGTLARFFPHLVLQGWPGETGGRGLGSAPG
jgi:hypothetical protein